MNATIMAMNPDFCVQQAKHGTKQNISELVNSIPSGRHMKDAVVHSCSGFSFYRRRSLRLSSGFRGISSVAENLPPPVFHDPLDRLGALHAAFMPDTGNRRGIQVSFPASQILCRARLRLDFTYVIFCGASPAPRPFPENR